MESPWNDAIHKQNSCGNSCVSKFCFPKSQVTLKSLVPFEFVAPLEDLGGTVGCHKAPGLLGKGDEILPFVAILKGSVDAPIRQEVTGSKPLQGVET